MCAIGWGVGAIGWGLGYLLMPERFRDRKINEFTPFGELSFETKISNLCCIYV